MCLHCLKILREMVINLSACDTVLVELVNLRNRTGGERRRKTLRDKRDVILLVQTFRQTSPFFLKTGINQSINQSTLFKHGYGYGCNKTRKLNVE